MIYSVIFIASCIGLSFIMIKFKKITSLIRIKFTYISFLFFILFIGLRFYEFLYNLSDTDYYEISTYFGYSSLFFLIIGISKKLLNK